jgi:pyrroloquinoline quinone (PQQ) biosynthesis protein C
MRLAQNLADELGFGRAREEPHFSIYARMLADFGIDPKHIPTLPATQALIDAMFDHCRRGNPAYGLAALCLGAEAIVPDLYRDLMQGFVACGVPQDSLAFFRVHIECDDGHGEVMRDILARMLAQDPAQQQAVEQASSTLIEARLAFFTDIERKAA